jgi:hypothetical protein
MAQLARGLHTIGRQDYITVKFRDSHHNCSVSAAKKPLRVSSHRFSIPWRLAGQRSAERPKFHGSQGFSPIYVRRQKALPIFFAIRECVAFWGLALLTAPGDCLRIFQQSDILRSGGAENPVTIQKRSMVMAVLFVLAAALYGVARYYSPSLILYVVEQSLAQKAPAGTDPMLLRERLHALLSSSLDQNAKMQRLLRISQYLEKVQRLKPEELNELMGIEKERASPAS